MESYILYILLAITTILIPLIIYKAIKKGDVSLFGAAISRTLLAFSISGYLITGSLDLYLWIFISLIIMLLTDLMLNVLYIWTRKYNLEIENRKMAQALASIENKYWFITEHSPAGIFIMDRNGMLEYVNKTFAGTLGYLPSELINTELKNYVKEISHTNIVSMINNCQDCKDMYFTLKLIKRSGSILNAKVTAIGVKNGEWKVIGTVIITDGE